MEEDKEIVNLGRKTIGYYIDLYIMTPFWYMSVSPTRKSWVEFKNGLISHKHEWSEEKRFDARYGWCYRSCKHTGCFVIDPD